MVRFDQDQQIRFVFTRWDYYLCTMLKKCNFFFLQTEFVSESGRPKWNGSGSTTHVSPLPFRAPLYHLIFFLKNLIFFPPSGWSSGAQNTPETLLKYQNKNKNLYIKFRQSKLSKYYMRIMLISKPRVNNLKYNC